MVGLHHFFRENPESLDIKMNEKSYPVRRAPGYVRSLVAVADHCWARRRDLTRLPQQARNLGRYNHLLERKVPTPIFAHQDSETPVHLAWYRLSPRSGQTEA